MGLHKEDGKTIVYTSWGTEWRPFGRPRRKRPLGSVILDDGIAEHIVKDVKTFLNSAEVQPGRCVTDNVFICMCNRGTRNVAFRIAVATCCEFSWEMLCFALPNAFCSNQTRIPGLG
jgi:hypothetical protein